MTNKFKQSHFVLGVFLYSIFILLTIAKWSQVNEFKSLKEKGIRDEARIIDKLIEIEHNDGQFKNYYLEVAYFPQSTMNINTQNSASNNEGKQMIYSKISVTPEEFKSAQIGSKLPIYYHKQNPFRSFQATRIEKPISMLEIGIISLTFISATILVCKKIQGNRRGNKNI